MGRSTEQAPPGATVGQAARGVSRFIPILSWLPVYDRRWPGVDVIAGVTLWGIVAPEALAYAVFEAARLAGIVDLLPEDHVFPTVPSAVAAFEAGRGEKDRR